MVARPDSLPHWPRLLSRELAAAYCGVSADTFDRLIDERRLPISKAFPGVRRSLWDRRLLDDAIDRMSGIGAGSADEDREARKAAWEKRFEGRPEGDGRRERQGIPLRPRRESGTRAA